MSRIKILSKDIADKIAAGEVIEEPLSVVKELVENSIDAGSSLIVVEIKNGGKDYIRVTDNGCGMDKDDIILSAAPHATSKISFAEDLYRISSLGFRGEALSSVAAVAKLEILSKTAENKQAYSVDFSSDNVIAVPTSSDDGTTIIVKDLFYNIPARRKFLKSDNKEASLISDFVSKIALAYPNIKFRFINNGTIIFSTPGNGDVISAVQTVFGPQNTKKLLPVSRNNGSVSLNGYVSSPLESRTNKKHQIFFVNGRLVSSKLMDAAVAAAYSDKLFAGRYPSAYLFLDIDPSSIDVNIHPRKLEIKFLDEDTVYEFMIGAIRSALLSPDSTAVSHEELPQNKTQKAADNVHVVSSKPDSFDLFKELREKESEKHEEEQVKIEEIIPENIVSEVKETVSSDYGNKITEAEKKAPETADRLYFSSLKVISQVFTTYIIAEDEDSLYIIDQHAAHERVMFEKLLESFNSQKKNGQRLLLPILFDFTPSQMLNISEALQMLDSLGFLFEEFDSGSYAFKEIPIYMDSVEAEEFLNYFFETAYELKGRIQIKRDEIISRSCKAAVKAHDVLSPEEIDALLIQLDKCENPYSCPHGRPTFLKLSESELEKMFKRK